VTAPGSRTSGDIASLPLAALVHGFLHLEQPELIAAKITGWLAG
jgi:hypothetical protein